MNEHDNMNEMQYVSADFPEVFAKVMRRVYVWMTLGLVITAFTSLIVASDPKLALLVVSSKALFWGLMLGELGLVFGISHFIDRMSSTVAGLLFAAYAIMNGVTLSVIFVAFTEESIASVFAITAGTFAAMSAIGFFIKKDLSGIGRFLTMLLIGLIIATVVNFFVASSGLTLILNYVGVLVFVGLTAYDTQKIKNMTALACMEGESDKANKVALMGSLVLYLDFINLFLYLLRIFGKRK